MNRASHPPLKRVGSLAAAAFAALLGIAVVSSAPAAEPEASADGAAADRAANASEGADSAQSPRRERNQRRGKVRATERAQEDEAPLFVPSALENPSAAPAPESVTASSGIVCRMMKVTGTRMEKRICKTPEEWTTDASAASARAQESMRQIRERAAIVVQPTNDSRSNVGTVR